MGSAIDTFKPALDAATNTKYTTTIGVLTAIFTIVALFSAMIPFATIALSFILVPLFITACTTLGYYAFLDQEYTFEEIREVVADDGIEVIKAYAIAQAANLAIQFALGMLLVIPIMLLSPAFSDSPQPGSLGLVATAVGALLLVIYFVVVLLISLVVSLLDVTVLFTDNRGVDAIKYPIGLLTDHPVSLTGYITLRSVFPFIPIAFASALAGILVMANATFTGWFLLVGLVTLPVWAFALATAFTYHVAYFLDLTDDDRYTTFTPLTDTNTDENAGEDTVQDTTTD